MNTNDITPTWVHPVDGATCAAFSRELWGMLSGARVDLSVVEFADYVIGCTLAFQRVHADTVWGETHDWMEETETFLARYLREFPIRELETAWEQQAGPLPVSDVEAISEAEKTDVLCHSAGEELTVNLKRAGIPCAHYGDGRVRVMWGMSECELRVSISVDESGNLTADIVTLRYDGYAYELLDEMASDLPLSEVVTRVKYILLQFNC
jgi:hypothetical protein